MTCIGNSGPLPEEVVKAIEEKNLVAVGILSGNRYIKTVKQLKYTINVIF